MSAVPDNAVAAMSETPAPVHAFGLTTERATGVLLGAALVYLVVFKRAFRPFLPR